MTNQNIKVDFCLSKFSVTNVMTQQYHINDSSECKYNMILGRDLLTDLGLDIFFSKTSISVGDGTYEGWTTPMIEMTTYNYKPF